MRSKPELLAPAGGAAQLKAAVQSGADAVYMGGSSFNARRSAKNFTLSEMKEMVDYCHLYGVKVHIAVNTLIKERELPSLLEYIYKLNDMGVDALIIQDIGAADMIKSAVPEMELHASTQMTVTSLEGVRYLENMGFDRVVLARELSKSEIEHICKNASAEIEVFVHGAICQCYSGQCLMSSVLGGRSGNRGCCAQPCRLKYTLIGEKNEKCGYLLSPKDMALINELDELGRMGVASLKIEGRLKRPEYVSAVTGIYRKYLDLPKRVSDKDMNELKNAFSRAGFTDGYFKNALGAQMMSLDNPSGEESSYTAEARARAAENADLRKIPVNISAYLAKGEPLSVTIYDSDGFCAAVSGTEKAETARNRPLEAKRLQEQLTKLGGTPFAAETADVFIEDNITIPISEINNVRRSAAAELIRQRTAVRERKKKELSLPKVMSRKAEIGLTASVMTLEQAEAVISSGIKTIYAPAAMAEELGAKYGGVRVIADTGSIFKPIKIKSDEVMVSSNGAAYFYKGKKLHGDFRLNVFNSLTAEHYSDFESVTLSPELNIGEIGALLKNTSAAAEVIGYGRLPLMIMKNCPLKAAGRCQGGRKLYRLKDRKNEEFPIICGDGCICTILNSKPLFMADKISDLTQLPLNFIRLSFTVEDGAQCAEIAAAYIDALEGRRVINPFKENGFTRGHFYRGVE